MKVKDKSRISLPDYDHSAPAPPPELDPWMKSPSALGSMIAPLASALIPHQALLHRAVTASPLKCLSDLALLKAHLTYPQYVILQEAFTKREEPLV